MAEFKAKLTELKIKHHGKQRIIEGSFVGEITQELEKSITEQFIVGDRKGTLRTSTSLQLTKENTFTLEIE